MRVNFHGLLRALLAVVVRFFNYWPRSSLLCLLFASPFAQLAIFNFMQHCSAHFLPYSCAPHPLSVFILYASAKAAF